MEFGRCAPVGLSRTPARRRDQRAFDLSTSPCSPPIQTLFLVALQTSRIGVAIGLDSLVQPEPSKWYSSPAAYPPPAAQMSSGPVPQMLMKWVPSGVATGLQATPSQC